jgi:hypothetical protein
MMPALGSIMPDTTVFATGAHDRADETEADRAIFLGAP